MRGLIVCMVAGICAVSAWANKVVSTSLVLAADLDYSGETLVVNDGVTIDLKGHDLIVSALDGQSAGAGEITVTIRAEGFEDVRKTILVTKKTT